MIEHLAVLCAGCLSGEGARGTADTRFLEARIARARPRPLQGTQVSPENDCAKIKGSTHRQWNC